MDDPKTKPRRLNLTTILGTPTPLRNEMRRDPFPPVISEQTLALPEYVRQYADYLHFEPYDDMLDRLLPFDIEFPTEVTNWLANLDQLDWFTWDGTCDAIEVYSDGSFDGKVSAWAFVVLAVQGSQRIFLGYRYGLVQLFLNSKERHTAMMGEHHALLWASHWLLKYVHATSWRGTILFYWDSIVAGQKAHGLYQTHADYTGKHVRHLQQSLESVLGMEHVRHAHVKAHAGNPPNEFVDVLAKLAITTEKLPTYYHFEHDHSFLSQGHDVLQWLWWWCLHEGTTELPCYSGHRLRWHQPQNCHFDLQQVIRTGFSLPDNHSATPGKTCTYEIKIGTYNCQSLSEDTSKGVCGAFSEIGRAPLLRGQLETLGVHLLGIQETRTPKGIVRSGTHLRIASGSCPDKTCGVELWVSLQQPFAWDSGGKPSARFQIQSFIVVHASPRILIVRHDSEILPCFLVVAHAPHSGRPMHERLAWWQDFQTLLAPHRESDILIFMDANVRVHDMEGAHFGDLSDGQNGDAAQLLYPFVSFFDLFAPATFSSWHTGPIATWVHPNGNSVARLDYVLLPCHWKMTSIWSWVDLDVHVGHAGLDHLCSMVQMSWLQAHKSRSIRRRKFDQVTMAAPESQHTIQEILQRAPHVPWDTNATEHVAIITDYFQQSLAAEFPHIRRNRNQAIVSPDAQSLFNALTHAKRALRGYAYFTQTLHLRRIFDSWKRLGIPETTFDSSMWTKSLLQQHRVPLLTKQLRKQLRHDKKVYIDEVASLASEAQPHEIYKMLRPVMPRTKQRRTAVQPLPQLHQSGDAVEISTTAFQNQWIDHFAALERGHDVDLQTFLKQQLERQATMCRPSTWTHDDIPPMSALEQAIRKLTNGKASGLDGLPAELLKASPRQAARILYPLLLKFCLRLEEAVQRKGGQLISLYKGRGPYDDCKSFRGILLLSTVGKVLRAAGRSVVNASYQTSSDVMQLGGKPSQQAIFGSQAVRSFIRLPKQRKQSVAILFCDIASAFYRTLRELAFGATLADEDIAQIARRLNLKPEVLPRLHEALHGKTACSSLGANAAQQSYLRESLSGTWFSMNGDRLIATTQGTRPGDSWADVVFNILFSQVIEQLKEDLQKVGLTASFPTVEQRTPFDPPFTQTRELLFQTTWADDLALMLTLTTPEMALRELAEGSSILLQALAYGMEATIGSGKTEAILILRGKESARHRRNIFSSQSPTVPVLTEDEVVHIPLTTTYKHLGGMISWKGDMMLELQTRHRKATSAFWRVARHVFFSKILALSTKKQIFQATVLSIFLWGSGAWPLLSQGEYDYFQRCIWKLYRLLVPRQKDQVQDRLSHDYILHTLCLPHPEDILPENRCRHLAALIRNGPDPLWAILAQDRPTLQAYQQAITWCWRAIERDAVLPHYSNWQPWIDIMIQTPLKWKNLVRRAASRSSWYRHRLARVQIWKTDLLTTLQTHQLLRCEEDELPTRHVCLICDRTFAQKRAWFLHAHGKHDYRSIHGQVTWGRYCFICQKLYATAQRLQHHLRYSAKCRAYFWQMHQQQTNLTPSEDFPPQHDQCPWVYFQTTQEAIDPSQDCDETKMVYNELWQALRSFVPPEDDDLFAPYLEQQLRDVLLVPRPYEQIVAGFQRWHEDLCNSTHPILGIVMPLLQEWLYRDREQRQETNLRTPEHFRIESSAVIRRNWTSHEFLFLHFYSGRRRTNDLQECFEALTLPDAHILTVLSIDTQVSPTECDLLDEDKQARWLAIIRGGEIGGIGSGPPCETWTVARFKNSGEPGPRPLRTGSALWGLVDLLKKESLQVLVGSELMGFSIRAMLTQALTGGFGFLEHPEDPHQFPNTPLEAPTIWQSDPIAWCLQTKLMDLLHVCQGQYGAVSPKPTCLMICGLDIVTAQQIAKDSQTTTMPKNSSIGKKGGQWATAQLKEFPPAFSTMIGRLFAQWIEAQPSFPRKTLSADLDWLRDFHVKLADAPRPDNIGADFFRGSLHLIK